VTYRTPVPMQKTGGDPDITYSAQDLRLSLLNGLYLLEGVVGDFNSLKIIQRRAGANMTVEVSPGWAAIQGDDVANQGMYAVHNDDYGSITIPAAPGSGSRTHRIVAQMKDKAHNGSYGTYEWLADILPDVGAGTPAQPNSAITLALVTVTAGTAAVTDAMINTNVRSWASSPGGILAIGGDLAAPSPGTNAWYRTDLGLHRFRNHLTGTITDLQNLPRGRIGYTRSTTESAALITGEQATPYVSTTFTADATRRYQVDLRAGFWSDELDKNFALVARWAAGASVTSGGTIIATTTTFESTRAGSSVQAASADLEIVPGVLPSGQVTIGSFMSTLTEGGGNVVFYHGSIRVTDVGI
jgi:hypothetical protein